MNNAQLHGFREDVKIIEGHMHLEFQFPVDETIEIYRKIKEYYGYDKLGIMSIVTSSKTTDITRNIKAIYIKHRLSPGAYAYASLLHHFDAADTAEGYLEQAMLCYNQGFDGFKMLEGKPGLRKRLGRRLDDSIYDKYYAFIEENELPIVFHVADPPHYWDESKLSEYERKVGWFCDSTFPTKDDLHEEVEGMLRKFPKLKASFAHFYFMSDDIDRAASFLDRWENVCFDLTPNAYELEDFAKKPDDWKAFFKKYRKRITYGTDTYNFRPEGSMEVPYGTRINQLRSFLDLDTEFMAVNEVVKGFKLDKDILDDIYYNNFYRQSNGDPRPVNPEYILKECNELLNNKTLQDNQLAMANLNTIKAEFEWRK